MKLAPSRWIVITETNLHKQIETISHFKLQYPSNNKKTSVYKINEVTKLLKEKSNLPIRIQLKMVDLKFPSVRGLLDSDT